MGDSAVVLVRSKEMRNRVLRFLMLLTILVVICSYFTFPTIRLSGNGSRVFAVMTPVFVFGLGMLFCAVNRYYSGVIANALMVFALVLFDVLISFLVLFQDSTSFHYANIHWGYYAVGICSLMVIPIAIQLYYSSKEKSVIRPGFWIATVFIGAVLFVGASFLSPGVVIAIKGRLLFLLWMMALAGLAVAAGGAGLVFSRFEPLFKDPRTVPAALTLACWGSFGLVNTAIFHYFNLWLNATMIVSVPLPYLAMSALAFILGAGVLVGMIVCRTRQK